MICFTCVPFKLEFTSDASGKDIGYYLDDIVIVYEQKVRPNEFNVSAQASRHRLNAR